MPVESWKKQSEESGGRRDHCCDFVEHFSRFKFDPDEVDAFKKVAMLVGNRGLQGALRIIKARKGPLVVPRAWGVCEAFVEFLASREDVMEWLDSMRPLEAKAVLEKVCRKILCGKKGEEARGEPWITSQVHPGRR